jgi:dienelactone hydrolase
MASCRTALSLGVALAATCLVQIAPAAAQVRTQSVDYKQGDTPLEGFLAYDASASGKRSAIMLVHHRDGIDASMKEQTTKLAQQGYVVFAADIFGKGILPKNVQEAQEQSGKYNRDRPLMRARAQAGYDWLKSNSMVNAALIGTVGYCFGGTVAVEFAHTGAPVQGTVSIHGSFRDFTPGAARNIKGRVLILHGADDPTAPMSEVNLVTEELKKAAVDWTLELYGGAHHGFVRPTDAIERRAYERSWSSMGRFWKETLAPGSI